MKDEDIRLIWESKLTFSEYNETVMNPRTIERVKKSAAEAETEEDYRAATEILAFLKQEVKQPGSVREIWDMIKKKYFKEDSTD